MKHIKIFKVLTTLACTVFSFIFIRSAYATASPSMIERARGISSTHMCKECLKFGPETEQTLHDGTKIYRKNVKVKKELINLNKNTNFDYLDLDVIFEYDKSSYAKVESFNVSQIDHKALRIRNVPEIRPESRVCVMSDKYSLYKKSRNGGIGKYLFDGYVDLLCSKEGEIGVNTEMS